MHFKKHHCLFSKRPPYHLTLLAFAILFMVSSNPSISIRSLVFSLSIILLYALPLLLPFQFLRLQILFPSSSMSRFHKALPILHNSGKFFLFLQGISPPKQWFSTFSKFYPAKSHSCCHCCFTSTIGI